MPASTRPTFHVVVAAYAALVYVLACVGYLVMTHRTPTPLRDSLTPAQRAIERASARYRGRCFLLSLGVSGAVVCVIAASNHIFRSWDTATASAAS